MGLLKTALVSFWVVFPLWNMISAKRFETCELAQLLQEKHGLPLEEVANWVCIAKFQSNLNSELKTGSPESGGHGLFQISDQYWCSPPGRGKGCDISCDLLRDDDLTDDLACVAKIYDETHKISGDGFTAWASYQRSCKGKALKVIEECVDSSAPNSTKLVQDKKKPKVFGRCELAKELRYKHKVPLEQIASWICIAKHESNYNTSTIGRLNPDGSRDHGIFQISDLYWCSPPGNGWACGVSCEELEDNDIADDVECIQRIYEEHQGISGDGFNAWAVYGPFCKGKSDNYIDGCFDDDDPSSYIDSEKTSIPTLSVDEPQENVLSRPAERSKVYAPCELANELRYKYNFSKEEVATWVCLVKHEANFNTSAVGRLNTDGSRDHGLFQISDVYWCSPPGKGLGCGLTCDELKDSDISNDIECIKKIYEEHQGLSGDGFNAWSGYTPFCKGKSEKYISGCFNDSDNNIIDEGSSSSDRDSQSSPDEPSSRDGKVFSSCELAKELRYKHNIALEQISTWVCIAKHESNFNTSAIGVSRGHGLFQISDVYWCSPPGEGLGCGLPCDALEDSDLADDVECIKKIYEEHTVLSGDGFNAFAVYQPYCKGKSQSYISGCFDDYEDKEIKEVVTIQPTLTIQPTVAVQPTVTIQPTVAVQPTVTTLVQPTKGSSISPNNKIYSRCELAVELRVKHRLPEEQIGTWVCLAEQISNLNTAGKSSSSGGHGMFQISERYWCDTSGPGKACQIECSKFRDNDITDDIECIQKIYAEHNQLSGDGFNAWSDYPKLCKGKGHKYTEYCLQPSIPAEKSTGISSAVISDITVPSSLPGQKRTELPSVMTPDIPVTTSFREEKPTGSPSAIKIDVSVSISLPVQKSTESDTTIIPDIEILTSLRAPKPADLSLTGSPSTVTPNIRAPTSLPVQKSADSPTTIIPDISILTSLQAQKPTDFLPTGSPSTVTPDISVPISSRLQKPTDAPTTIIPGISLLTSLPAQKPTDLPPTAIPDITDLHSFPAQKPADLPTTMIPDITAATSFLEQMPTYSPTTITTNITPLTSSPSQKPTDLKPATIPVIKSAASTSLPEQKLADPSSTITPNIQAPNTFPVQKPADFPTTIIPDITPVTNPAKFTQEFLKTPTAVEDPDLATTLNYESQLGKDIDRPSLQPPNNNSFANTSAFSQKSGDQFKNKSSVTFSTPAQPLLPTMSSASRFSTISNTETPEGSKTTSQTPTKNQFGLFPTNFNEISEFGTSVPTLGPTTKPITSKENNFPGFRPVDTINRDSPKKYGQFPGFLNNRQSPPIISRYDLQLLGQQATPNPQLISATPESTQTKFSSEESKAPTNIYDFYFDLYNLPRPSRVWPPTKIQNSPAVFDATKIKYQNTVEITKQSPYVYHSFQTNISKSYVSSDFSANPKFQSSRIGNAFADNTNQAPLPTISATTIQPTINKRVWPPISPYNFRKNGPPFDSPLQTNQANPLPRARFFGSRP